MRTWEGGGFEEGRHPRALKQNAGGCRQDEGPSVRVLRPLHPALAQPERLALAQVVPPCLFSGIFKLTPLLSDGPGLMAHAPPLEVPLSRRIR